MPWPKLLAVWSSGELARPLHSDTTAAPPKFTNAGRLIVIPVPAPVTFDAYQISASPLLLPGELLPTALVHVQPACVIPPITHGPLVWKPKLKTRVLLSAGVHPSVNEKSFVPLGAVDTKAPELTIVITADYPS